LKTSVNSLEKKATHKAPRFLKFIKQGYFLPFFLAFGLPFFFAIIITPLDPLKKTLARTFLRVDNW